MNERSGRRFSGARWKPLSGSSANLESPQPTAGRFENRVDLRARGGLRPGLIEA